METSLQEADASMKEPSPEVGNSIATDFISGIGQLNNRFVIMLDIENVFTFEQINAATLSEQTEAEEIVEEAE